jgi:hypothetical protein
VRRGLPLYEDLRQKLRALPVVHGDETSWRHDGDNFFVWYVGNDQLAFYVFAPDRFGQTAQSHLGEHCSGVLVSDAYAAYNAVHPKDWQSCLFHLKNKAKELESELALLKGQVERTMRPVVLMRHEVHCTRSPNGLENHSVLRSLFETSRRQGKQVHQFFLDLFTLDTHGAQAALYRHPLPQTSHATKKTPRKKPP